MPDTQIKDGCTIRPSFLSKALRTGRTPRLLLAYNAPSEAVRIAEDFGCEVLRIPPWNALAMPVCGHPDMLVFSVSAEGGSASAATNTDRLILPIDYYRENASFWRSVGLPLTLTAHPFGKVYPADIGLNQLVVNGTLYGRLDAAAPEVLAAYPEQVNVRQGYARCSVLKLTETAAITADRSIAAALVHCGCEVLLIRPGHIRLDGYDYGFIGGASFPLPDGAVCFFGDLSTHPDAQAISDFAARQGVRLHTLPIELTDFGGGILIG